MDKMLLRAGEVATLLGLCRSKVYEMLATGELPSIRIGRSVRVPTNLLREWVELQTAPVSDQETTGASLRHSPQAQ